IFARKTSMQAFRKGLTKKGANRMNAYRFEAVVSAFVSKPNPLQFGVILFYTNSSARSGVVSHEMTHATTYFWKALRLKRKNIFKDAWADERFAWIQGNLVAQYWK